MGNRRMWTIKQVRALGAATRLVTAASILGVGRSTAYTLAQMGKFPVPLIRLGTRYIVPVHALLKLLHADADGPEPGEHPGRLDPEPVPRVHGTTTPADYASTDAPSEHTEREKHR